MKYSELISRYVKNELSDEEKRQVEQDIEKQLAIEEYIIESMGGEFDAAENTLQDMADFVDSNASAGKKDTDSGITEASLRSYIKRRFIKAGIVIGAVVLALTLFVIYGVPQIINSRYYDPTENVGPEGYFIPRINKDMDVFSELFYSDKDVFYSYSSRIAPGKYTFNVVYRSSDGSEGDIYGLIEKDNWIIFDQSESLQPDAEGKFNCPLAQVWSSMAGQPQVYPIYDMEPFAALEEMEEDKEYTAYVTLNKAISYEDLAKLCVENRIEPLWCPLCKAIDGAMEEDGICYSFDSLYYNHAIGFRPDILMQESELRDHVCSLLRYMEEREVFWETLGCGYIYFSDLADCVEKEGLTVYGFVVRGTGAELQRLKDIDDVVFVYTDEYADTL